MFWIFVILIFGNKKNRRPFCLPVGAADANGEVGIIVVVVVVVGLDIVVCMIQVVCSVHHELDTDRLCALRKPKASSPYYKS